LSWTGHTTGICCISFSGTDMDAKVIAGWLALALVIFWVVLSPTSAAHVVHNIGTFLSSAADGIMNFFSKI